MGFRELLGWWTSIGAPSHSLLYIYSTAVTGVVSFKLTNNIRSKVSPWVLWAVIASYWTWGAVYVNPKFIARRLVVQITTWGFTTDIWSGGILGGLNPLSCGIWHELQVDSARIRIRSWDSWLVSTENSKITMCRKTHNFLQIKTTRYHLIPARMASIKKSTKK